MHLPVWAPLHKKVLQKSLQAFLEYLFMERGPNRQMHKAPPLGELLNEVKLRGRTRLPFRSYPAPVRYPQ